MAIPLLIRVRQSVSVNGYKSSSCVFGKQIEQGLSRYLEGSGVTDHLGLFSAMSHSDNTFLPGSFMTRTVYKYQFLASTLNTLLNMPYNKSSEQDFET